MDNATTNPPIQVLVEPENDAQIWLQILMLFSHYLIAFPVFLICWFALISYLKKKGHITSSEAQTMMEELNNIPKTPPMFLLKK